MARYLRNRIEGGTFFLTLVTHGRRKLLTTDPARRLLRGAIEAVQTNRPFETVAIVLCPDHLHAVWSLPEGDSDYSERIRQIKERFTKSYLPSGGTELPPTDSQLKCGQRGLWQARFWEHTVRDEADLKRCVDYVHWNPVKHGLTTRVSDYLFSSFHRYVNMGEYPLDWGGENPCPGLSLGE